ncbi:hypothetical protein GJ496_008236 [Pomphorhynchus laevis]|nr:hypothetical protein GJ496_008236 [Pomphorhynchus laevis]
MNALQIIIVPTYLLYCNENRNLFVALEDGNVLGFTLAEDLNSITATVTYGGHVSQVTCLAYNLPRQLILSTGEDKRLSWNRLDNGHMLGSVIMKSVTNCICIDNATGCVFVGEESGDIQFINIEHYKANEPLKSTELCRHKASINKLIWDDEKSRLISCSADKKVMESPPVGIGIIKATDGIIACYTNGTVVFWNMGVHREQPLPWQESDKCQRCNSHFFWDMKEMWQKKKMGLRQHHCRRCGRAVCQSCSRHSSVLPVYGFEIAVRVCADCNSCIDQEQKASLASFADVNNLVTFADYDPVTNRLLIVAKDKTITVWETQFNKNTE